MSVSTPCYCSREDVQASIDFTDGITTSVQQKTDRAIQDAARNIEGNLHRLFYPYDSTKFWDWPLGRTTSERTRGGCGWTSTTCCA